MVMPMNVKDVIKHLAPLHFFFFFKQKTAYEMRAALHTAPARNLQVRVYGRERPLCPELLETECPSRPAPLQWECCSRELLRSAGVAASSCGGGGDRDKIRYP